MKRKAAAKKRGSVTINQKLSQLSEKVAALSELAEDAVRSACVVEEENFRVGGELQDSLAKLENLEQCCRDLVSALRYSAIL